MWFTDAGIVLKIISTESSWTQSANMLALAFVLCVRIHSSAEVYGKIS
jgi:hypothetical protein